MVVNTCSEDRETTTKGLKCNVRIRKEGLGSENLLWRSRSRHSRSFWSISVLLGFNSALAIEIATLPVE